MKNDQVAQMKKLGVTHETKSIYHHQKYRYNKLSDALNFAKIHSGEKAKNVKK